MKNLNQIVENSIASKAIKHDFLLKFSENDFVKALNWYATRQRRFGKTQDQVRAT